MNIPVVVKVRKRKEDYYGSVKFVIKEIVGVTYTTVGCDLAGLEESRVVAVVVEP